MNSQTVAKRVDEERPDRWWDKLNKIFFPVFGPAQVGPYEVAERPSVTHASCPLCGQDMALHDIDRTGPRTQVHCPVVVP